MARCNYNRCGFFYICPCFNKSNDCFCKDRMTPKQCEKEMIKLNITNIEELWKNVRGDE